MPEKPCYYDVLGLEKGASDEDIKRAYRRLALFWHPDKNTAEDREDSSDVFRLITEAYAVLSDPKKKEAYDRDGHPPSKSNKASSAAPTKVPSAPPAPQPPTAPSAQSYPSAPSQQGYGGGWGGDGGGGGWQGMSMAGGYGQGWEQQQQQQQQAYPFQQGGFMQQQQFPQQAGPFSPQPDSAYGYGSQYGQQAYPYPYQQQQQQGPQAWAPPDAFGNYDNAYHEYGAPPSAAMPQEPASGPPSTALVLPDESPPEGSSPYPAAASHGMVAYSGDGYQHQPVGVPQHAAAAQQSMMAPQNGGYPYPPAPPSYAGLPPAAWAPPSTNPPSSDSEESSDSESEGGDQNLAVARYGAPETTPPRRASLFRRSPRESYPTETRTDPSGALVESAGGIIPRHPNKVYPRETRYMPPKSSNQSWNEYPRETREEAGQQQRAGQGRPGVSRGDSGIVVKLQMGKSKKPGSSTGPPTSVGPLARRGAGASSRRGSEGSVGGLMQEMDRVFGSILGGSAFGAGLSVDMADETGSRRSLSRGFSVGGGGSSSSRSGASGSGVAATMTSSHTVVNGRSRTLFARTERTVVGMDGTRETDVQEYVDNRDGKGQAAAARSSRGGGEKVPTSGASESRSTASTGRRSGLKSFFGR